MKINQIIVETTTAGSVATVSKPMGETQKRSSVNGLEPAEKVMSGKAKKKGPYANSLSESAVKELSMDLKGGKDGLNDADFAKKYGKSKAEVRAELKKKPEPVKKVDEAKLEEDDIILVPGQGRKLKSGFIKHDPDRAEHEGETLKNSLHTIIRVAKELDRELSMRDNFPEWVSEKIGATKGMLVSVADYLVSAKEMQHDPDAMDEGAKVDRMVKHIEKSEKKLGHSKKEAENIAWATANKRGMLDNKNKKK